MIALRRDGRAVVRCRVKEFAPETLDQSGKDALFYDLDVWGMTSADIGSAVGVSGSNVRYWRTRDRPIPDVYWRCLLRLHIAAEEAVNKLREPVL